MRTYRILNEHGHVIAEQTHDDSIRPPLLAGHTAQLVAIDGEQLHRKSQPVLSADEPVPDDAHLETEDEFRARREAEKAERAAAKAEREADKAERTYAQDAQQAETRHVETDAPATEPATDTTA